jgi:hypothetical protein
MQFQSARTDFSAQRATGVVQAALYPVVSRSRSMSITLLVGWRGFRCINSELDKAFNSVSSLNRLIYSRREATTDCI